MSAEYIASLYNARIQFARYVSIPIWFICLLSELFSIIVFLSLKTFRQSSCAFYLLIMSVFNLIRLVFSTSVVVISIAFSINWTSVLIYYCQIRNLIVATCVISAITMLCLAIIDQYFATCTRQRWQKWSDIKLAYRLTIIVSIFWTSHGVLYMIYFRQISPINTAVCIPINPIFLRYHVYGYFLTLSNLFPLIAVIFGIMSYRNARTLTTRTHPLIRHELDKQLTVMVLVEICVYVCTYLPYSITSGFLQLNTNRNPVVLAQLNLINAITLTINILTNGSSFYTYICVSRRFRRQAKYVLYDIYINRFRQNRIGPEQITAHFVTDNAH
ncbi:unnamed protein product [Adineta steineri]|uniref:G-protein coupled receptors family 1 profile domain-containing protein n=1 Tax=Adineta steineri TaxID=433720 RepID=A0A816ED40_9BILA|nr:unnamed protein product [Adineta steineri]CAF1503306.1 unnamed protein product [Adineta steineri]CAF1503353.1 unnamed protein product [Adineta steineri]CAF1503407.1 unnamed protein product [Adineta steineri]CAF1645046.1 unnamed protein product [Adineta steineri]